MEKDKKTYTISFGDSGKYKIVLDNTEDGMPLRSSGMLERIEKDLKDYLDKKFPGEPNAYLTTPKIVQVSDDMQEEVAGYPEFVESDLAAIKEVLTREMEVMMANAKLDANARYSDINAKA